jgi:glycosyltransferase involved in cell wall biosynthesis
MIIPQHPKLKWLFGLTDWHSNLIKTVFPSLSEKVHTLNYGIDPLTRSIKVKNSFIYSSFPNRGLVILLRMWPKILKMCPDATLNVYCNFENRWVNETTPDQIREIKETIIQQGVISHGWVNKNKLKEAWERAEYWLYPCIFEETFCLTAMEAAISRTFAITNNLAALAETVGDRGLIVQGNPQTTEWQETVLVELEKYILNIKSSYSLTERNYEWARERSWKNQTNKFIKIIKN